MNSLTDFCWICQIQTFLFGDLSISSQSGMFSGRGFLDEKSGFLETQSVMGGQRGVSVLVAQSCLTLCDPMDCSPPGFSVRGILQVRILEWVAIPFSKGSS